MSNEIDGIEEIEEMFNQIIEVLGHVAGDKASNVIMKVQDVQSEVVTLLYDSEVNPNI